MKRGVTIKDLCARYRTITARPASPLQLPSMADSGKLSEYSLSSSTHSNQSLKSYSTPATPIRLRAVAQSHFQNRFLQESLKVLNVIDERHLVLFGLVHGFLRRIEKYPILQLNQQRHPSFSLSGRVATYSRADDNTGKDGLMKMRQKHSGIYSMFTGNFSFDEICLSNELNQSELDELVEKDPDVVVIWK